MGLSSEAMVLVQRKTNTALVKEHFRNGLDDDRSGFMKKSVLRSLLIQLGSLPGKVEDLLEAFGKEDGDLIQYEKFVDWIFQDEPGETLPCEEAAADVRTRSDSDAKQWHSEESDLSKESKKSVMSIPNIVEPISLPTSPLDEGVPNKPFGTCLTLTHPLSQRDSDVSTNSGASSNANAQTPGPVLLPIGSKSQPRNEASGSPSLPIASETQPNNSLLLPIPGKKSSMGRTGTKPKTVGSMQSLPGIDESPPSVKKDEEEAWRHVQRSDFKTIGYLGDGGFGQVRLVIYLGDGQKYAMKSISHASIRELYLSGSADSFSPMNERDIGIAARKWRSPFIVQLYATFQTPEKLHYVYELCPGGDLFELLSQQDGRHFDEPDARFYSAEITLGLMHLHSHDVVHGDIKLENVLIGKDCHAKLTDLGSAIVAKPGSKANPRVQATFSPPELRDGDGEFGKELDCWQLGYATVTMLTGGYLNLNQEDIRLALQQTMSGVDHSEEVLSFCNELLESDRRKRLGFPHGAALVRDHAFFETLDWDALENKLVEPPFMFEEFPLFGRGRFESSTPESSPSRAGSRRVRGFTWSDGPDADDVSFSVDHLPWFESERSVSD